MNLRSTVLAVLSGLLLAVAFPLFNLHFLAWVALIPFFFAVKGASVKNGLWLGGIMGIVFFAITVHWIAHALHFYGGFPLFPSSLITLCLSAYLALYPALFGACVVSIRSNKPNLLFIAAPVFWTTLELARTSVLSGFPWSLLGYTQCSVLPIIQIADITGVYGVSFFIVLVNAALATIIMDRKNYGPLITAVVVGILVLGYGFLKLRAQEASSRGIEISVIQGNIEQDNKWDRAYQSEVMETYKRLTSDALTQQPDLIVWPETATPFYFTGVGATDRTMTADLVKFVKRNHVALLTGSPTYEMQPNRRAIGRNSAFLINRDGRIDAVYHKIHLVPFGEYVPLEKVLFFIKKMVRAIGAFQAGDEYTIMTVPYGEAGLRKDAKLCTVICYEIIFPDLVRKFVDRGAEIVTTITNDAWFGKTAAPYQHFSMAVFRAVENRVPIARAANTGISGFIDSRGRILETSAIFTEADLTHKLEPSTERSLYTRYGDIFSCTCMIVSLILLATVPKKANSAREPL